MKRRGLIVLTALCAALGAPNVALYGPGSKSGVISGSFTPLLQAGDYNSIGYVPCSIAQSGLVPLTAKSIVIKEQLSGSPEQLSRQAFVYSSLSQTLFIVSARYDGTDRDI